MKVLLLKILLILFKALFQRERKKVKGNIKKLLTFLQIISTVKIVVEHLNILSLGKVMFVVIIIVMVPLPALLTGLEKINLLIKLEVI